MDNSLKFDGSEFAGQDVASLPDTPNEAGFTAQELKVRFDNVGKMLIALGKHNDLVDALTAQTAAAGIGATADNGDPTTVQALIEYNNTVPLVLYHRTYGTPDLHPKRIAGASVMDALNWLADTVRVAIGEIFDGIELTGDGGGRHILSYAGFPKDGFLDVVNFVNNRVTARETEIAALAEASEATNEKLLEMMPVVADAGETVTILDGAEDASVLYLLAQIEPVQSGSGDPTPGNPRPITGWTGATVTRTSGSHTDQIRVEWGGEAGEVYGGTLDVTHGVLTVRYKKVALSSLSWTKDGSQNYFYTTQIDDIYLLPRSGSVSMGVFLCSTYASSPNDSLSSHDNICSLFYNYDYSGYRLFVRDDAQGGKTADEFKAYLGTIGAELCYLLAAPVEYQLAPQEVKTRFGGNVFSADTGDVSVTYRADVGLYLTRLKGNVLEKDNAEAYTPTGDYNPATKKYIDDAVIAAGAGDMTKAAYDTTNTGNKVDTALNAERLGGQLPAYYAAAADLAAKQDALTFDAAPSPGSTNPVTSGGVFSAVYPSPTGVTADTILGASHAGRLLMCNNNADITLTVPANASAAIPVGSVIQVCQNFGGAVTVAPAEGVSIRSLGGRVGARQIAARYGVVTLKKTAADTWVLYGDLL